MTARGNNETCKSEKQNLHESTLTPDGRFVISAVGIHNDPSLKKHNIDVSVDGGVVTLSGTVATDSERAKAKQLATIATFAPSALRMLLDRPR